MFRGKGPLLGRTNVLGEKDRKNLRQTFVLQYPKHGLETFQTVFPADLPLQCFSLKGQPTEVYMSGDVPLLFTTSKKRGAQLIPTLHLLWRYPDLVPAIVCQVLTPKYLIRGADLMLPGCIVPPGGYHTIGMDLDQVWAVRIAGNPLPFAVGQVLLTAAELAEADKGKVLLVHHVLGDGLLKMGTPDPLPEGFTSTDCVPVTENARVAEAKEEGPPGLDVNGQSPTEVRQTTKEVDEAVSEGVEGGSDQEDEDGSSSEEGGSAGDAYSSQAADATVEFCLLEVLRNRLTDAQLPMDASAVYGMITKLLPVATKDPVAPALQQWLEHRGVKDVESKTLEELAGVDLKKTSWRNMKRMTTHFKKNKLWTVKELRGGIGVVKVNRAHPLISGFKGFAAAASPDEPATEAGKGGKKGAPSKAPKKGSKQDGSAASGSNNEGMRAVIAYQITAQSKDLLAMAGITNTRQLLREPEIKHALGLIFAIVSRSPALGETEPSGEIEAYTGRWDALVAADQRLLNLCVSKADRQALKTGADLPPISNDTICQKFISNGMKAVTLLLASSQDVEEALQKPDEFGMIEADAHIVVSTQRTKRFTRTRVTGIHNFSMIDPKQLAEKLQKACAAAATTCEVDEVKGKTKPMGVMVQGAFVPEVCQVLESAYGLPPGMIRTA